MYILQKTNSDTRNQYFDHLCMQQIEFQGITREGQDNLYLLDVQDDKCHVLCNHTARAGQVINGVILLTCGRV